MNKFKKGDKVEINTTFYQEHNGQIGYLHRLINPYKEPLLWEVKFSDDTFGEYNENAMTLVYDEKTDWGERLKESRDKGELKRLPLRQATAYFPSGRELRFVFDDTSQIEYGKDCNEGVNYYLNGKYVCWIPYSCPVFFEDYKEETIDIVDKAINHSKLIRDEAIKFAQFLNLRKHFLENIELGYEVFVGHVLEEKSEEYFKKKGIGLKIYVKVNGIETDCELMFNDEFTNIFSKMALIESKDILINEMYKQFTNLNGLNVEILSWEYIYEKKN